MTERHRKAKRGANNPNAKLTAAKVRRLREEMRHPLKHGELIAKARKNNISPQTLCDLRARRIWGHVK